MNESGLYCIISNRCSTDTGVGKMIKSGVFVWKANNDAKNWSTIAEDKYTLQTIADYSWIELSFQSYGIKILL